MMITDISQIQRVSLLTWQRLSNAVSRRDKEKSALTKAKAKLATIESGQQVVQAVAVRCQESAHTQIAAVVTRAIQCVYGENYEFKIEFEKKRGKTEAVLKFIKDGNETNPLLGSGGGVLDVASFALQLVCMVLQRPSIRRLLVMDEPFRHLAKERAESVRGLLEELSRELNIQIIMITHSEALATGKVIRI